MQDSELFMNRYKKLVNLGLSSCWDKNGHLIPHERYKEMLILGKNNTTKFQDLEGILKGKYIVDKLKDNFELLWSTKLFFQGNNHPYEKFEELDMGTRRMMDFTYPVGNQCNNIARFSGNNSSPVVGQANQSSKR